MSDNWEERSDCSVCGGKATVVETWAHGTIEGDDSGTFKRGDRVRVLLHAQCAECRHVEASST